jgi:putative membrane protein
MSGGTAMLADFLLAYSHFILVFVLLGCLVAEIVLVRPGMDSAVLTRVGRIDLVYGIVAGLLLVVGFLRVYFGLKSPEFYWSSGAFHAKLALYILIGLASLPPTFRYIRWRREFTAGTRQVISADDVAPIRKWLHIEALLMLLVPLFASLLARDML